jgi:hypothetical protein
MIRFLHLEKRFEKELGALRSKGEKEILAARKADLLLKTLAQNGPPDLKRIWKLTGWGEKRIEGCIKYDLGEGFRLICFRRGETLFVSFIGEHEACQKYLDHHCGRHNWVAKENGTTVLVRGENMSEEPEVALSDAVIEQDYEDLLMGQIDEKMLRTIFKGLVKNGKPSDHLC